MLYLTCHRIIVSRASKASVTMAASPSTSARVSDSRSRVKPASQPRYPSRAIDPFVGGLRSASDLSFHSCSVRESENGSSGNSVFEIS